MTKKEIARQQFEHDTRRLLENQDIVVYCDGAGARKTRAGLSFTVGYSCYKIERPTGNDVIPDYLDCFLDHSRHFVYGRATSIVAELFAACEFFLTANDYFEFAGRRVLMVVDNQFTFDVLCRQQSSQKEHLAPIIATLLSLMDSTNMDFSVIWASRKFNPAADRLTKKAFELKALDFEKYFEQAKKNSARDGSQLH